MQDSIAHISQQLPCAIMFYNKRFRSPFAHIQVLQTVCDLLGITDGCRKSECAFCLGSHTFPEKITTGIVFCIGHGLLLVLVCDDAISQTVLETLRTRSSAANRLRAAVYHRRFRYD